MVLNFTVAVSERVRGVDGGYEERPSYIDCAVFGARAEAICRYLTKGSLVMVQGRLRQLRDMCGAGKGEMQWKKNGRKRSRRRKRWS